MMPDYELYDIVSQEIKNRRVDAVLWRQAIELAGGDKEETVEKYMQLRLKALKQDGQTDIPPEKPAPEPAAAELPAYSWTTEPPPPRTPGIEKNTADTPVGGVFKTVVAPAPVERSALADSVNQRDIFRSISEQTYGSRSVPQLDVIPEDDRVPGCLGADPWGRWMAKMIDCAIFFIPLSGPVLMLYAALLLGVSPADTLTRSPLSLSQFSGRLIAVVPASCFAFLLIQIMDAFALHYFGGSVGRALMQITVYRLPHASLKTAIERNLKCLVRGMYLGIPVIAVLPMLTQFRIVESGKQTSWDMEAGYRVKYGAPSNFIWIVGIILIATCLKMAAVTSRLITQSIM